MNWLLTDGEEHGNTTSPKFKSLTDNNHLTVTSKVSVLYQHANKTNLRASNEKQTYVQVTYQHANKTNLRASNEKQTYVQVTYQHANKTNLRASNEKQTYVQVTRNKLTCK